jgi:copper chaperone CopZ
MGCPPQVQSALENVDGVESVDVDFATKTATITASSDVDAKALIAALEGTKFKGEVKK